MCFADLFLVICILLYCFHFAKPVLEQQKLMESRRGFMFEPVKQSSGSTANRAAVTAALNDSDSDYGVTTLPNRLHHLDWCSCSNCKLMPKKINA